MTDIATLPKSPELGSALPGAPHRRHRRWLGATAVLLVAGVVAWWAIGRKVWTDGGSIRVAEGAAPLREVLWTPPLSLGPEINTTDQEYEPSVSADGSELFFVRGKASRNAEIYLSHRDGTGWSTPQPLAPINSPYDELGPRLTADGQYLLFYSNRPGGLGGYDLWAAARAPQIAAGWDAPFDLGPAVNSEFDEYSPAPTPDGKRLIFATNRASLAQQQKEAWRATIRASSAADFDLWIADLDPVATASSAPAPQSPAADAPSTRAAFESLPSPLENPSTHPASHPASSFPSLIYKPAAEIPGVNTPSHEGASCMSPAGDFLYFASDRPGGRGKFDIYRSRVTPAAGNQDAGIALTFSKAENLGPSINSPDNETDPQLALGGFRLYFSSDRSRTAADAAASPSGDYDLLQTDSREVFAERQGRPIPQVSASGWIWLLSALLLVPLLLYMRNWNDHKLNLLQKCLLVSLLLHVVLTFSLTLGKVSSGVLQYVRQETGLSEVVVNVDPPRDAEVVRRQPFSESPVTIAPPGPLAPLPDATAEHLPAPAGAPMNAPAAGAGHEPLAVQVAAPKVEPPPAAAPAVVVTPIAPQLPDIKIDVNVAPRIAQAEAAPDRAMPQSPPTRVAAPDSPPAAPMAVNSPLVPAASPADLQIDPIHPLTHDVPRAAPSPVVMRSAELPAAPEIYAAIAPGALSSRVAAPALPGTATALPALPRAMEGAGLSRAEPRHLTASTPAAVAETQSLASLPALPGRAGDWVREIARPVVPLPEVSTSAEISPTTRPAAHAVPDIAPMPAIADLLTPAGPTSRPSRSLASSDSLSIGESGLAATPLPPAAPRGDSAGDAGVASRPVAITPSPVAVGPASSSALPPAVAPAIETPQITVGAPRPPVAAAGVVLAATDPASVVKAHAPADGLSPINAAGSVAAVPVAPAAPMANAPLAPPLAPSGRGVAAAPPRLPVATGSGGVSAAGLAPASGDLSPALPDAIAASKLASTPALAGALGGGGALDAVPVAGGVRMPARGAIDPRATISPLAINPPTISAVGPRGPDGSGGTIPTGPIAPRLILPPPRSVLPEVSVSVPKLSAPESLYQRAADQRRPLVQKRGGSIESEQAVERALAYLSRQQEPGGRWTIFDDENSKPGKRPASAHDMACTGLSVLAFLASDHTPAKEGPYRETVGRAVDFLISEQGPDGDLRGLHSGRGDGSAGANLYDHAIATMALAEAALMTGDPRYTEAAYKAAAFIVEAQNRDTGGWRYVPGDPGDTSVFGWQMLALHDVEALGFKTPDATKVLARKYLRSATEGPARGLARYQPSGRGADAVMTAEALFCRVLLDEPITDAAAREASEMVTSRPPAAQDPNLYYWYYASLSLSQMQNDAWKRWNEQTRDVLVAMQKRTGPADGSWISTGHYDRGGRVYCTALGALTLEVYYRYLPLNPANVGKGNAPAPRAPEPPKPARRTLEPN